MAHQQIPGQTKYHRHAGATDEIYRTMMAERTGEDPENYRDRPFDMDLLDYAPSSGRHVGPILGNTDLLGTDTEIKVSLTRDQAIDATARALGVTMPHGYRPSW